MKNYQRLITIDIFARFNEKQSASFWTILHSRKIQVQGTRGELFKGSSGSLYDELEKLFVSDAEANTTNNDMGMENHFYTREVKKDLKKWEGYQKKNSFLKIHSEVQ